MDAVVGGRRALALLLLVFFASLQGAAGVEHAAEQPLLPLDHLPVEPAALEPLGQILGLVGHLAGPRKVAAALQLLQLLGQRPLAGAELAELLPDRPCPAIGSRPAPCWPSPPCCLASSAIRSSASASPDPDSAPWHVSAGAEQLVGRRVERVHRAARLLGAFPRVG